MFRLRATHASSWQREVQPCEAGAALGAAGVLLGSAFVALFVSEVLDGVDDPDDDSDDDDSDDEAVDGESVEPAGTAAAFLPERLSVL